MELESEVSEKFRGAPRAQMERVLNDLHELTQAGARSVADLVEMTQRPTLDPGARARAAWFLARLGPAEMAAPILRRLLFEGPSEVRVEAVRSLGLIGARDVLPQLIALAKNERDIDVRSSAVYALGLLHDPAAVDALLSIAQDRTAQPRLRGLAFEQLGEIGDERQEVVSTLEAGLDDAEPEVAFWSAHSLAAVGNTSSLKRLEQAASSENRTLPPFGRLRDEQLRAIDRIRERTHSA